MNLCKGSFGYLLISNKTLIHVSSRKEITSKIENGWQISKRVRIKETEGKKTCREGDASQFISNTKLRNKTGYNFQQIDRTSSPLGSVIIY